MADETIVIAGWIDVDPASRDEVVERSVPLQRSTRDDEPGCSAYVFAADPAVAGRIHVYERWDDAAALDAHFQHPNYHAMRQVLSDYPRLGSQIAKMGVDRTAPVYSPEGVASATYWPDA